uniref:Uncharacterized protein n=1 Tax=Caenorhabditis japonica TaxID=281687 RepID=A0A8R1EQ95_CAEJA
MGLVISNGHMVSSFLGIASSVAILLVFTIFFISVFVFVGGSREARGVKWYQIFKTGDTQFTSPQLASFDSSSLFSLHDRLLDARPCASRAVGAFVISPKIRYPILVLCTAFIFFRHLRICEYREEGYATRAINWLSEFAKFEKASIYDVNPDTFVPVVNLVFLPSETYRKYASDIIMDRFQTQIVKSRMYLE